MSLLASKAASPGTDEDDGDQTAEIFQRIRASQEFIKAASTEEGGEELKKRMKDETGGLPEVEDLVREVVQAEASLEKGKLVIKGPKTLEEAVSKHRTLENSLPISGSCCTSFGPVRRARTWRFFQIL